MENFVLYIFVALYFLLSIFASIRKKAKGAKKGGRGKINDFLADKNKDGIPDVLEVKNWENPDAKLKSFRLDTGLLERSDKFRSRYRSEISSNIIDFRGILFLVVIGVILYFVFIH